VPSPAPPPPLFDRALLGRRLDRAIRASPDGRANFWLDRAAEELSERLSLVTRSFARAADVGSPGPEAARALAARAGADLTLRLAPTFSSVGEGGFLPSVGDFERSPLAADSFDLVVSLLALHHANDLPGALIQIRAAMKPDGVMLAALIGGETLTELRQCLTIAESELTGGAAPRVAPLADVRAVGGLLQRAGFALPVVDSDRVIARYGDLGALVRDLRALGATNALNARSRAPLRRDVFVRAAAIYAERFADPDGRLRATVETIWISGWAPHESQPKPLKPGSAAMRLEDALKAARDAEQKPS
jgi:SAM-dependent methyltransferase